MKKKLLCLDVGAKVIGVAVGSVDVTMATPRDEIRWGGNLEILRRALLALEEESGLPLEVVLGKPRNPAPAMATALETIEAELRVRGATLAYMDEHVSTQEAANRIAEIEEETGMRFPATRRDSIAAQIILERYLEAQ